VRAIGFDGVSTPLITAMKIFELLRLMSNAAAG
jgi:hypothetical protein